MTVAINEELLDERLARLEKARPWSPRLVSKLENLLRSESEDTVFPVNPMTFAKARNVSESEAVDLFLYATHVGLFDLGWHLLCPKCSCVVESFRNLRGVQNRYHCKLCQSDFMASLDDLIAVTFTIRSQIRELSFHHPESLSAEDYFFKISGTAEGLLPDGTPFVEVQRSLIQALHYVADGETLEMGFETDRGILFIATLEGRAAQLLLVDTGRKTMTQAVQVTIGPDVVNKHTVKSIQGGPIKVTVVNESGARATLIVATLPEGFEFGHAPIQFMPFLNGKRLINTQVFRELFRAEVVRASEGLGVRDVALLFTDLKGSTALYDRIGDLNAFALVQGHFDQLQAIVVRHNGAVIKTIGDAVMAAFDTPRDAVEAALAMRDETLGHNAEGAGQELILKIGIHRGAAIAVTLNDRLDYFGQTVNVAARVQGLADSNDVIVSQDAFEADGVADLVAGRPFKTDVVSLKGIRETLRIFKL